MAENKQTDWNSIYVYAFNTLSAVLSQMPVNHERFRQIAMINLEQLQDAVAKALKADEQQKKENDGKKEETTQGSDAKEKVEQDNKGN